jgi:hypothetical protein
MNPTARPELVEGMFFLLRLSQKGRTALRQAQGERFLGYVSVISFESSIS